jgi:hypothetical protein
MSYEYDGAIKAWHEATSEMPWGVQRVFMTALESVADGSIVMAWGSDLVNGHPCLVNSVSAMINSSTTADNSTRPSQFAPAVVQNFDRLNSLLHNRFVDAGLNPEDHIVSPLAADVLLKNFGPLNEEPASVKAPIPAEDKPYVEMSDADLMAAWVATNTQPAPTDITVRAELVDMAESPEVMAQVEKFLKSE